MPRAESFRSSWRGTGTVGRTTRCTGSAAASVSAGLAASRIGADSTRVGSGWAVAPFTVAVVDASDSTGDEAPDFEQPAANSARAKRQPVADQRCEVIN